MDKLVEQCMLVIVVLVLWMKQESAAKDPDAFSIEALRLNHDSSVLQLNISWEGAYLQKSLLYDVAVNHIPTTNCSIEKSIFAHRTDILCAPVVAETEHTSILLPRDTRFLHKHECDILPSCVYEVVINPLDFIKTLKQVYHVPECVGDLCSCYYEKHLPTVRSNALISMDLLHINWTLGDYAKNAIPYDVVLKQILITVRRVQNEDLHWGGQENSKKSVLLPVTQAGSYQFSVADFPGNKSIFIVHVDLYDSRRCVSEALPARVVLSSTSPTMPTTINDEITKVPDTASYSSKIQVTLIVVGVSAPLLGILCIAMIIQRQRKQRRATQNWPRVYVPSSDDLHAFPMEENRLYVDKEIVEARVRGEADLMEVPHSCLRIGREIGKGAFGRVFMASASKLAGCPGTLIVAVKQLKKCSKADQFDEFLDEIAMMKRVGRHPNIVTLLGCCTIKEPLTMIMEYIGCGDLLEYLRKIRAKHLSRVAQYSGSGSGSGSNNANQPISQYSGSSNNANQAEALQGSTSNHSEVAVFGPAGKYLDIGHMSSSTSDASYITQPETLLRPSIAETTSTTPTGKKASEPSSIEYVLDHKELHDFARQIACGMQHLEKKGITHRDLAARNILIDERKTLKISDFGLSRSGIYVNTRNKKVPLRWLSIEAIRDNLYSSKSDVWAFGIVLWEIGTLGGYPYPTVSNHELLSYLQNGDRLERPENCTSDLYKLMQNCWKPDPDDRPSFRDIRRSLEPHRRIYIDFNEIEPTYVFPPTADQISQSTDDNKE